MTTPVALGPTLRSFVEDQLGALVDHHLTGWRIPRALAGHRVGADVRADLAWTLTALAEAGSRQVAGWAPTDAAIEVLGAVDGAATHTFFSYRVAEAVVRLGGLDAPGSGWTAAQREELVTAADSTDWVPLLDDGLLPANYAAVLARGELARAALGVAVDPALLTRLLDDTRALLGARPTGFLDDDPAGGGRYDIYSVDLYLFTEPFADRLPPWEAGLRAVADVVVDAVGRLGAVVPWGRSTGLLGACHTIELAALLTTRGLTDAPERWLDHARHATAALPGWFEDGLTTAHRHRSPYRYRGPARRLQLTLDALGKLAWAAATLGADDVAGAADDPTGPPAGPGAAEVDRWAPFEHERPLGVWLHRSPQLRFSLPVTGTVWSDYLPAPHNPGLFDTPVDRPLATFGPTAFVGDTPHTAAGVPLEARHEPGSLLLEYDGWRPLGDVDTTGADAPTPGLAGGRRVRFRVQGRTLHVDEALRFASPPDALVVQVPEAAGHPLVVTAEGDGVQTTVVATDGISEWRSFWGPLPRVHQLELEPAAAVDVAWSVTPVIQVATDAHHHWYHRSLYDPMAPAVQDRALHRDRFERADAVDRLATVDVYHLHWPEWVFDTDADAARRFVDVLARSDTRLVWTQHNLLPHRAGDFHPVYAVIAGAADTVIHHSEWGRERALATHPYGAHTRHVVIPHGHWGGLMARTGPEARQRAEAELGLEPCALRIGIVGAPRPGKDTLGFAAAVAASSRTDVQLLAFSLEEHEVDHLVDDPRVRAEAYAFVEREEWDRRLAAVDLLAFPFAPDTPMLTTGVFADAVGAGLPALVSGWGFLAEVLGDAGLPMGDTPEDWTRAVEALDRATVEQAAVASRALQERYDWSTIAASTLELLADLAPAW